MQNSGANDREGSTAVHPGIVRKSAAMGGERSLERWLESTPGPQRFDPKAAEALRRPLDLQRIRTVAVRPRRPAQAGNFDEAPDADAGSGRAQDYVGRTVT